MSQNNKRTQFGALSLNLDTMRRLDVAFAEGKQPGAKPQPKDTDKACPVSTKTRVTAHCC
ncbi:MAG TPA: hypothetical protein VHC69_25310 [Polyangiaceae bacterium]|nr:hypothetical protein [Polyangiaceae bacterium]